MKTAYIELNTTNQISSIVTKQEKPFFRYKGIVFYPNANVTSLTEILHQDYRYFILDMGILNPYNLSEFLRCDKPFLICSPCKWRHSQIQDKLEKLFQNQHYQHCTVIMNLSEKESNFSHFLKPCEHIPFPFIQNPFHLGTNVFHAIYRILKN